MTDRDRVISALVELAQTIVVLALGIGLFGVLALEEEYLTVALMAVVGCLWFSAMVLEIVAGWAVPSWIREHLRTEGSA